MSDGVLGVCLGPESRLLAVALLDSSVKVTIDSLWSHQSMKLRP
jgi:hypothetical protein